MTIHSVTGRMHEPHADREEESRAWAKIKAVNAHQESREQRSPYLAALASAQSMAVVTGSVESTYDDGHGHIATFTRVVPTDMLRNPAYGEAYYGSH